MIADNLLPVWPFMPNWREPITERLVWATAVLASDSGAEQAYSSRLSPRREFEAVFNPIGDSRTFFDLFISQIGGQEFMVPVWHDQHKLSAAVTNGATRIDCDTEFGEFMDGGMAMLVGADPWSHQTVRIDEVDATGFTLVVATNFTWPEGGRILPLRRTRIDLQSAMTNLTDSVGQSTLRFALNQANDLPDNGAWAGMTLDGYPVITIPTNWAEPVEMDFSRIMETEDNGTGIAFIRDIAERAFRSKNHIWQLRGRQQNWEFRQFLYRMGGRRSPVWIPTGASDMIVAQQANVGANNVQVRRVGLTYVGGPKPGRDRFLAKTEAGMQARRITGLGAPATSTMERINVDSNLAYELPVGTPLSFLEIMRADGDSIELLHYTDTEGMTECTITFRSFSDTRDPSGSNFVDLPSGAESVLPCGTPDDGDNPCMPRYNAYTRRIVMTHDHTNPDRYPAVLWYTPIAITADMFPNGKTLAADSLEGLLSDGPYNTADPVDGTPLSGDLDNNNPDGSPGGPMFGTRMLSNDSDECVGWEIRFYFPVDIGVDLETQHQYGFGDFATGGCHNAVYRVYDNADNLIGEYDYTFSDQICCGGIGPFTPVFPI